MILANHIIYQPALILIGIVCFLTSCKKNDEAEDSEINYSWIPVGYQLDVGTADELNSPINIFFINEQTGFLSNKYLVIGLEFFTFVRTDDGCSTFSDISDQIDGFVKEICFPDDQTGYLVTDNYSLYKTTNQGQTWNKIESAGFGEVIQAGSNLPENIFIMYKESYNDFSFRYSNDGGNNWAEHDLELNPFFGLDEVKFQFLENDPEIGFFNNMHKIFNTTNGGESWEEHLESNEYSLNKYWFIDEETVYISSSLGIFKSIDGGDSFQKLDSFSARYWQVVSENEIYAAQVVVVQRTFDEFQNLEVMEVDAPTDNKYDKYIRGISFYESRKGYAISGNGIVYKTVDL